MKNIYSGGVRLFTLYSATSKFLLKNDFIIENQLDFKNSV